MTTVTEGRMPTPVHLWVVGIVTLLFNSMGIISYLSTKLGKLEEMGMTPSQIAFMESYPAWATAVWAMGVWGAFAGSVLLLLRSKWAVPAMAIALAGLIGVTMAENVILDTPADMATPLGLKLSIWVSTLFLLFYSVRMKKAGVLR
ncbi:hypothetical protein [Erythrobacter colymbi]|uniref:hypothetical protein n=1 Tax=Erythrobacter colymbi TaxID=1161202 RepID=UPI000A3A56ED|nr:hypothetical protein [Erythrobacter colymbi]